MNLYRHALVWLLRAGGICIALTAAHVVTTLQIVAAYERDEPGMTYLLDLVAPVGVSLFVGAL